MTALAWARLVGSYRDYTHTGRTVTYCPWSRHFTDSHTHAGSPFTRPSRAQPATSDHSLDPLGSPHDSRSRPVACPRLHTCAPRRRMVRQRISNELKSKELGGARLSPCTASHSGLLCTQACPSTSTSHADSQGA